jgi:hypothetical protein
MCATNRLRAHRSWRDRALHWCTRRSMPAAAAVSRSMGPGPALSATPWPTAMSGASGGARSKRRATHGQTPTSATGRRRRSARWRRPATSRAARWLAPPAIAIDEEPLGGDPRDCGSPRDPARRHRPAAHRFGGAHVPPLTASGSGFAGRRVEAALRPYGPLVAVPDRDSCRVSRRGAPAIAGQRPRHGLNGANTSPSTALANGMATQKIT